MLEPVFCDKDGILLVEYLEKGAAITAKYYIALLDKWKQQLISIGRGKLLKGILFFLDNSVPHKVAIMCQNMVDLHFEVLKHPNLVHLDYYLFPNLKNWNCNVLKYTLDLSL